MIRRLPVAVFAMLAAAWLSAAQAGSLLDAFRARRAQSAQAGASGDASAESLNDGDTKVGKVTLPPGARAEQDLAYGSDPAQKVDVYLPKDARNAPMILMVHGGAWMIGDKGNSGVVANKVAHWLPKGYIVASANYRMSRSPNPLEQAEDVGRALAFMQTRARTWGGDPSHVVLMGHSSGAHVAALLTADPGIATRQGAKPWLGSVMLDSAALNVVELMQGRHARFYDRVFGADPAHWAETSPYQRLAGRPVPSLLVCSSRRSDSCPASRAFADKITGLGGRASVLPVDFNHGDVNVELGRTPAYTAQVDDFIHSLGLP